MTTTVTKDFDLSSENLRKHKKVDPVQDKLDKDNRSITVLVYESQRKPGTFQCKVCDSIWQVKQARYVTQQQRGCSECAKIVMSTKAKNRSKKANGD